MNPSVPVFPTVMQVVVAGVGGQGVIHLGKRITHALEELFPSVQSTQDRGLAKMRGSVSFQIRAGNAVKTPQLQGGSIDLLVALEIHEALRHAHKLGPGSACIWMDEIIEPSGSTRSDVRAALQSFFDGKRLSHVRIEGSEGDGMRGLLKEAISMVRRKIEPGPEVARNLVSENGRHFSVQGAGA